MKKKSGEVQQFLIPMLGIIFAFVIMLYGIHYSKTIIVYNNANQLARKYILKMEREGFLSDINVIKLKGEIEDLGCNAVDISRSTTEKVNYGDDVELIISFTQPMKTIDIQGFSFSTKTEEVPITITKSSTAKY